MNLTHIEHIGIAVKNLENSISYWEKVLGLKCSAIEIIPEQESRSAFFQVGQTRIELFERTASEYQIGQCIEKNDEGNQYIEFAANYRENPSHVTETIKLLLLDEQSCIDAVEMSFDVFHPKLTYGSLTRLSENKKQIHPIANNN